MAREEQCDCLRAALSIVGPVLLRTVTDPSPAALQVVEFVRGEEYARFTRIIYDTAPTGHT